MPTTRTFAALWLHRVATSPDRVFLLFEAADRTSTVWTYEEFERLVRRGRSMLAGAGIRRGDAVHVALRNCPAFIAIWLACATTGAVFVPVDPASSERELELQVRRIRARLGVFGIERAAAYEAVAARTGLRAIGFAESSGDLWDHTPLDVELARRGRRRPTGGHVHLGDDVAAQGRGPHAGELPTK